MKNEVVIIIQTKPNLTETTEEKWAMFLAEVAGNLQTELAWTEICSGIDDIYGNNVKLDKEKRRITIHFPDIKWCGSTSCEKPSSYMALFNKVERYEDYIDAIYLRVGEDREDMEEKYYGEGWDLAYIERKINIIKGE